MRRVALAVIFFAGVAGLAGCKREKPAPPPPPPPKVTVVRPASVPVRDYWTYNGYLEQTKAVEVRSKIRGYLNAVKFIEGTEVAEDDLLYTIDKLEFKTAVSKAEAEEKKAAAEVIKADADQKQTAAKIVIAKAAVEPSRTKAEQASESYKQGAETKINFDLATAEYEVARATYEAAVAANKAAIAGHEAAQGHHDAAKAALKTTTIQLGYTDIKAKIGGRISRTLVDEGALIQADTTHLTTILKVDQLYVYFDAPEADLIAFRLSDPHSTHVPVEVGVTNEVGYPHVGRIDFRENKVEVSTGTVRLRGIIDNPLLTKNVRLLFPGMYARVRVPKSEPTPQLVLPEDCLLSGQEGRFVYVVMADGKVDRRVVTVGASVWKAPPAVPGVEPPSWTVVNPKQPSTEPGQTPPKSIRNIKSVVAVTFHEPLKADERVILYGLQQARQGAAVAAEEWNLTPPAEAKPAAPKK